MRTLHLFWTSLSMAAVLSAGCTRSECGPLEPDYLSGELEFTCSMEQGATKTHVHDSGTAVWWSPGDEITVLKGSEARGRFTCQNTGPAATTTFKGTLTIDTYGSAPFYGVHPYSEDCTYDDGAVTVTVPSLQTAVAGSFDPEAFPSLAESTDLNLAFHHLCGGLRFKVANTGVTTVTFTGHDSEVLSGEVKVRIGDDGIPYVSEVTKGSTQVTLSCSEGLTPGTWYYISMLPAHLSEGFTVTLSDGIESLSYVSQRSTLIKRSVFGQLSKLDDGLSFRRDWTKNDFVHNSLLLSIPNCSFAGVVITSPNSTINTALTQTHGHIEVAQMFANGDSTTEGISSLIGLFNLSSFPFFITDYRESVDSKTHTPYSTYSATPSLYGTTSGIGLKTYWSGNELNIEASLYFKEADTYKAVVLVTEEGTSYKFSYNSGRYTSTNKADYLTRYVVSDILGDDVTVTSAPEIKYRSYKVNVSDAHKAGLLRVLVYILRPYGSRTAVTNGSFGTDYVDNAFSVRAGREAALPTEVNIDSEINSYEDGGTIEL